VLVIADLALQLVVVVLGLVLFFNPHTLVDPIHLGSAPTWGNLVFALTIAAVSFTSLESAAGLAGEVRLVDARAVIDDTAAYYDRHTQWQWCAGVGTATDGRALAWNLVSGVNDPPENSERTVWVDGTAAEVPPCEFADDLSSVDELRFSAEALRSRRENLLLIRSDYRQPFGTFSGRLPGGVELAEGFGVMEHHDVWW